jgi:glycosyltransferase involved in cell wall biosynthesis
MSPTADISVVICTYNNARLLDQTLAALAQQKVSANVSWEALVVDNACSDDTPLVVQHWAAAGLPGLRRVCEGRPGVAFARRRGVWETRSPLIGYVDDDCLLADDWIEQAVAFAQSHPRAGAFGGRNELLWQSPPGEWVAAYGESLARQDFGDCAHKLPDEGKTYPVGAGLVVRREAILSSGWTERRSLSGRQRKRLSCGEDTEINLLIRQAGWEIWYTPQLRLRHVVPDHRTTLSYLCRLHHGFGRAEVYLRQLSRNQTPTLRSRLDGATWALGELGRVLARFPQGYVVHQRERPTWWIRLSFALGCLRGAARYLVTGRAA